MANPQTDPTTIIGPDASIKGEIHFESPARVLGRIEGTMTSKSAVHVAEGAECRATVTARELTVDGLVDGNVQIDGRLELKPGGVINGDITAQRMSMAEGASINGHLKIGGGGTSGAGRASASAEAKPAAGAATNAPAPAMAGGKK